MGLEPGLVFAVWWFGAAGLTLGCLLWEVFWRPSGSGLEVTFYSHFASSCHLLAVFAMNFSLVTEVSSNSC